MNSGSNNWLNGVLQSLRADMKKTVSLGVLGVVFLIMLGRQVLTGGKAAPASAGAAIAGRNDPVAAPSVAAAGPSRSAIAAEALAAWSQGPVPPVSRNFFSVRIEYFPLDGSRTTQSDLGGEGFWSSLEKSLMVRTDEKVRHENLIASFKVEAEKLQLQSTLPEARKAMINGQLVGEGSVVANFRVVKIEPRKVTVEREGIALTIQMK